jgi:hypothetical protein
MHVTLPPFFRINTKENGNIIRQVAVSSWRGEAEVEPLLQSRMRGFTVTLDDGSLPILLLTNAAQPSLGWTHAIRLRGWEFDHTTAGTLDLTAARWVEHPEKLAHVFELADYERHAAEVRAS